MFLGGSSLSHVATVSAALGILLFSGVAGVGVSLAPSSMMISDVGDVRRWGVRSLFLRQVYPVCPSTYRSRKIVLLLVQAASSSQLSDLALPTLELSPDPHVWIRFF